MNTESNLRLEYQKELEYQRDPYEKWIKQNQKKYSLNLENTLTYRILFMEECAGNWDVTKYQEDIVILYSMKGELDENAIPSILTYMNEHPEVALAYADEDYIVSSDEFAREENEKILWQIGCDKSETVIGESGRIAPWFKPDFSKDTLMSFRYFGNIVFARVNRIRRANVDVLTTADSSLNLYDFYLKVSEKAQIGHLPEVLFHKHGLPSVSLPAGTRKKYNDIKLEALKRRGQMAKFVSDEEGYTHVQYIPDYRPLVSVIIPSKDHAELLRKCLKSITEHTSYKRYELIVVDNGSNDANKQNILQLKEKFGFEYLYESMEFNFSAMCNLGVKQAKGDLLLFLNDDIEIIQDDWMDIMVGQAMLSYVGAVGVKLIYPEKNILQHAGVSNLAVGPVHRLHGYSDAYSIYYGRNRMTYNVLAVTAAAMMVKKAAFEQVDGFCEALKVAYNDVDLCLKLYEAGYEQVIRNDVKLIHHESLSRGNDLEKEKRIRLDAERELLYSRHKQFAGENLHDPYCRNTEYWKRNSLYLAGVLYDYENKNKCTKIDKIKSTNYRKNDNLKHTKYKYLINQKPRFLDRTQVMISVDRMETGEIIEVEGWALVTKNDNIQFKKHVLLKNEKNQLLLLEPYPVLREDVAENIEGQTNVLLSGFVIRIPKGELQPGKYQVGVVFVSQTNKKYYTGYSEEFIIIEEE